MLGTPEDIDDVDFLARRKDFMQMIQVLNRALTQHGVDSRCDGDDPVAEALQRTGDAMARARGVCGKSDDRNDASRCKSSEIFSCGGFLNMSGLLAPIR